MPSLRGSGQNLRRKKQTAPRKGESLGRITIGKVGRVASARQASPWRPSPKSRTHRLRMQMGGETVAYYDSVYEDQELSHRAKAVYIDLKDHSNQEGTCWPGINTIAAGLNLSRSTVKRALEDLVKAGLLEKSSRWRENGSLTSNLYQIK